MAEGKVKTQELKPFFNSKGRAYMFPPQAARSLKKSTRGPLADTWRARDTRLIQRILKALSMGMRVLVLKEKTLKGKSRTYEIDLQEIKQKERPVAIKAYRAI